MSLPMRERELKLWRPKYNSFEQRSLPMRERELKRSDALQMARCEGVAPHAGARIETTEARVQ